MPPPRLAFDVFLQVHPRCRSHSRCSSVLGQHLNLLAKLSPLSSNMEKRKKMSGRGGQGKRRRKSTEHNGEPQIDVAPSQRHVVEHPTTGHAGATRAAGSAKTVSIMPRSSHSLLVNPAFRFTADKLAEFSKQGFVVVPNFLQPSTVSLLRTEFDRVYSHLHQGVHDEWVLSAHQHVGRDELEWLWELATAPALLDALEAVLGTPNVVLFSTQLATKRPGQGTEVPWHQDGERCQTVWIPIDDVYVLLHRRNVASRATYAQAATPPPPPPPRSHDNHNHWQHHYYSYAATTITKYVAFTI